MITPAELASGVTQLAGLPWRQDADAGARHIVLGFIGDDWQQQRDLLAEAARLT